MFDIGFWELIVIVVVALLVVGPERLPKFAYSIGLWVGKIQRFTRNIRFDLEHELRSQELNKLLAEQKAEFNQLGEDLKEDLEHSIAPASEEQGKLREQDGSADSKVDTAAASQQTLNK